MRQFTTAIWCYFASDLVITEYVFPEHISLQKRRELSLNKLIYNLSLLVNLYF